MDERAAVLIPKNAELAQFSASRIFAAVYPEAVKIAALIAAPRWRVLATGPRKINSGSCARSVPGLASRTTDHPKHGDVIMHWMKFDSGRPIIASRENPTWGKKSEKPPAVQTRSGHSVLRVADRAASVGAEHGEAQARNRGDAGP